MGARNGEHDHGPAGGSQAQHEEFPRQVLRDLVREAEERERVRMVRVEWGLGLALATFALAFPVEVLVGRGVDLVTGLGAGAWSGPHLLPALWAALLGRAGLGLEPAAFLLSALALLAIPPLAGVLGRRLGAPPRLASAGALALALTPGVWHAASLPGPDAPGLAASLALCAALLGRGGRGPVLALACLAPLVDLALLWLLPAVALALRSSGARATLWAVPVVASLALHGLAAALDPGRGLGGLPAELGGALLALDVHRSPLAWPALSGIGALGFLGLGLAALVLVRRGGEEEPPPPWLWAWCLAPLAVHLWAGLPPLWLAGPALLGGLDLLSRAPESRALRVLALGVAVQLALLLGSGLALRRVDPLEPWRVRAQVLLEPQDLVLSADPEHLYWLRARAQVEALDLRGAAATWEPAARAAAATGRRVVLDLVPGRELEAAIDRGALGRLEGEVGLERL